MNLVRKSTFSIGLMLIAFAATWPTEASGQFSADSKWVPDNANCLVLINPTRIFSSPIAVREDWASSRARAFDRGLSIVPIDKGRVMLASQIDFASMDTVWTVGVFYDEDSSINLQSVAERDGLELEELAGRQAVTMPGDHYLIQLEPNTVGVIAPANRQTAHRWIQDREAGRPRLTKYLDDAIAFADRNADVIIAFDLANTVSASEARSKLVGVPDIKASDVQIFANAAARLEGVTLGVTVRDVILGSFRIDFRPGTEGLNKISKDFILRILSNQGLMIDDLDGWELSSEASRLVLKGPLTSSGLRHISLLVNQPVRAQLTTSSSPGNQAAEVSIGRATREFIDTLQLYFKELDEHIRDPRRKHAHVYGRWFNKYADKVDMLSVARVDPEMSNLAGEISSGFREISQILISAEARTRSQQSQDRGEFGGDFAMGGMGFGYRQQSRTRSSIQQATRVQKTADAVEDAKAVMQSLRGVLGDTRRQMSTKYPQDF